MGEHAVAHVYKITTQLIAFSKYRALLRKPLNILLTLLSWVCKLTQVPNAPPCLIQRYITILCTVWLNLLVNNLIIYYIDLVGIENFIV